MASTWVLLSSFPIPDLLVSLTVTEKGSQGATCRCWVVSTYRFYRKVRRAGGRPQGQPACLAWGWWLCLGQWYLWALNWAESKLDTKGYSPAVL